MIENPSLQTHFANVEAIALDRDMPDEVTDLTSMLFFLYLYCVHYPIFLPETILIIYVSIVSR